MPNVSMIPIYNVSNYTSDPIQGVFIYSAQATNYVGGMGLMVACWLIFFLAFQNFSKSNAGIAASLVTTFATWILFFYAGAVPLAFGYLTIAVFLGFVLVKVLEK